MDRVDEPSTMEWHPRGMAIRLLWPIDSSLVSLFHGRSGTQLNNQGGNTMRDGMTPD